MPTGQSHPPQNLTLSQHGACCWKKLRQLWPRDRGPVRLFGESSMPRVGTIVGSQTGARSQTAGAAGLVLFSVAVGVMALFTLILAVADARSRADRQDETQAAANAAAVGAAAALPKGTAAVLRSAGQILGSQKAEGLPGRFGAQAIQVGHWDAARQSFASGAGEPKAVRITVRLSNERTLCALFLGRRAESPIEASAVAVLDTGGHPVVAAASATGTATR
jgi:hypothetical protein